MPSLEHGVGACKTTNAYAALGVGSIASFLWFTVTHAPLLWYAPGGWICQPRSWLFPSAAAVLFIGSLAAAGAVYGFAGVVRRLRRALAQRRWAEQSTGTAAMLDHVSAGDRSAPELADEARQLSGELQEQLWLDADLARRVLDFARAADTYPYGVQHSYRHVPLQPRLVKRCQHALVSSDDALVQAMAMHAAVGDWLGQTRSRPRGT